MLTLSGRHIRVIAVSLAVSAATLLSQSRTRSIATFQAGATIVVLSAMNDGYVSLYAINRADKVIALVGCSHASRYANLASDSLPKIATPKGIVAGEIAEFALSDVPVFNDAHVRLSRVFTARGSSYTLSLSDEYRINNVRLSLSQVEFSRFTRALKTASGATRQMNGLEPKANGCED